MFAAVLSMPLLVGLMACEAPSDPAAGSNQNRSGSSQAVTVGPDIGQGNLEVPLNQAAIDLLPKAVRDAGQITVGLEPNNGYPNSVKINDQQFGLTYDLAQLLGKSLGLKVVVDAGPFSSLIPGLQAKRFDFSSFIYLDTEERRKVVDFVYTTYALGDVVLASEKSPNKQLTFADLCGLSVGTTSGSVQQQRLERSSDTCTTQGKPVIDIQQFPSNPETVLAAVSQRVDAVALPMGGGTYAAKANPKKLTLGALDNTIQGYSGMALPKGSELKPALQAAMVQLAKDSTWKKTLELYGQEATFPDISIIEKGTPYVKP